jgi:hypothetical protein
MRTRCTRYYAFKTHLLFVATVFSCVLSTASLDDGSAKTEFAATLEEEENREFLRKESFWEESDDRPSEISRARSRSRRALKEMRVFGGSTSGQTKPVDGRRMATGLSVEIIRKIADGTFLCSF